MNNVKVDTAAEALLVLLKERGIEYLFGNAGTDAAPLIEAFARLRAAGLPAPRPVTVAHEMCAVSMAHGYARVARRPAAVFVHVSVGTANAAAGIMNASRQGVPVLVMAGRTPVLEDGGSGARDLRIHWAQESLDQAAMIREYVKWDYELRDARQLGVVVDRALAASMSRPRGPVYLSLPRERLMDPVGEFSFEERNRLDAGAACQPDPASLERAAELVARARSPLVVANNMGREPEAVAELVAFAEAWGVPVVEVYRESMNFPADHPLHLGFAPGPLLATADLIIAVEADVPWLPRRGGPRAGTPIIQVAEDPFFSRYPIRGFPIDVGLVGSPALSLDALRRALEPRRQGREREIAARTDRLTAAHHLERQARRQTAEAESTARPVGMSWLSRCIGAAAGEDTLIVNEYDVRSDQLGLNHPGTFFGSSAVSGLGWGFGAALGAKLAAPDRTVICGLGDGAYIFNNPVACHMTAAAEGIPVLVVVFNNQAWNAVRSAVADVAPDGTAVRRHDYALTYLQPSPDFHRIAEACGGYGERVDDPASVPDAIQRGLERVRDGQHALLNVICAL